MTDHEAPYHPDGRATDAVRRALGIRRPCPPNLCALPLVCQHRGTACADAPSTPEEETR